MDKSRILTLVSAPKLTSEMDTELLQRIVKEYPYFHSAYLFLLQNLRLLNNDSYDQALQNCALRVNDRKVLFNLVNNISPIGAEKMTISNPQEEISLPENRVSDEFTLEEEKPIEKAEENYVAAKADIENPEIEVGDPLQITGDVEDSARVIEFDLTENTAEDQNETSENLIDNFLSSKDSPEIKPENAEHLSLIDKFITENPVFSVNKLDLSDEREDVSLRSLVEDDELVSETLAKVYETQKLYDKSIAVYEKLILKIPEKSTYFASQIDKLRTKNK